MRALVWHGKGDVRCDNVPDPKIENDGDVIVKITATAPLLEKIEAGEIDPSFVITHKRRWKMGRSFTRRSATRKTAASRSS